MTFVYKTVAWTHNSWRNDYKTRKTSIVFKQSRQDHTIQCGFPTWVERHAHDAAKILTCVNCCLQSRNESRESRWRTQNLTEREALYSCRDAIQKDAEEIEYERITLRAPKHCCASDGVRAQGLDLRSQTVIEWSRTEGFNEKHRELNIWTKITPKKNT